MCVLSIKVSIRKKSGNLLKAPRISSLTNIGHPLFINIADYIYIYIYIYIELAFQSARFRSQLLESSLSSHTEEF